MNLNKSHASPDMHFARQFDLTGYDNSRGIYTDNYGLYGQADMCREPPLPGPSGLGFPQKIQGMFKLIL